MDLTAFSHVEALVAKLLRQLQPEWGATTSSITQVSTACESHYCMDNRIIDEDDDPYA